MYTDIGAGGSSSSSTVGSNYLYGIPSLQQQEGAVPTDRQHHLGGGGEAVPGCFPFIESNSVYQPMSSVDPPFKGAYKTELCRYVLADTKCRFGAARCKWAHSIEEMHQHRRAILNQARRHYDGGKVYRPRAAAEPRPFHPALSVAQLPLSIWDELQSCSASSTPPATNVDEGIFGTYSSESPDSIMDCKDVFIESFPTAEPEDILACLATLERDMEVPPLSSESGHAWGNSVAVPQVIEEQQQHQQQQSMVEGVRRCGAEAGRSKGNNDIDEGCSIQ